MQCVKLGANDAKEVTPDMFDAAKQKDIRCERHASGTVLPTAVAGCHVGRMARVALASCDLHCSCRSAREVACMLSYHALQCAF